MVLGIQTLGIIFGAFLIYLTFLNYKRKELHGAEFGFWTLLWGLFMYLVLFPRSIDFIVESLNLVRTMDLFTIIGFMFLIVLTFYNYIINMHNKRRLERAVRAIALRRRK